MGRTTIARLGGRIVLLLVTGLLATGGVAQAQTPNPRDYQAVTWVSRVDADRWLKEQIRQSGGDIDHQRYHFIVGFSTSHFGSDPVNAIAMRRMAFGLLNNTLASGDRVTPAAWEMEVWNVGEPITLTGDAQTRALFVNSVPYAPGEHSRGGHDVERSLYDTLQKAVPKEEASSTIILLLTNSNQSQIPPGTREKLFGANNRQLRNAIRALGFREPVRKSFTAQTARGQTTVDVTALFPTKLTGLAGAPNTPRYPTFPVESWQPAGDRPAASEKLPNPAAPAGGEPAPRPSGTTSAPAPKPGGFPWPLLIGALIVAGIIAALLAMRRKPSSAKPTEAPKPAPKGQPLPGEVQATVGTAPRAVQSKLEKLTTESRWALTANGADLPALVPVPEDGSAPAGTVLARVGFENRKLRVEAEGDTLFDKPVGTNPAASGPRKLLLAPGERVLCQVKSSTQAGAGTRFELHYRERSS